MSCEQVLVIAGEASGDIHAADFVRHLQQLRPGIRVSAVGGQNLKASGADIIVRNSELSVVGLVEVISHFGPVIRAYRRVVEWLENQRPSLLVLVDFPEFNLMVAARARKLGIPVFYYISPQIWAWRQGRVKRIKRLVDRMAVILPFEKEFYSKYGFDVDFVGHPLLDSVHSRMSRAAFCQKYSIPPSRSIVCLMPGSRLGEIRRHIKLFMETAVLLRDRLGENVEFFLPVAPGLQQEAEDEIVDRIDELSRSGGPLVRILHDAAHEAMASAGLVIAASGTVTLEAAILNTPMIVTYRISPLTYLVGQRLVKVKWVSLVNLIAGREVVPEMLQDQARPENIARKAIELLENRSAREQMIQGLQETVRLLGEPGAAARAAAIASEMLRKHSQGTASAVLAGA